MGLVDDGVVEFDCRATAFADLVDASVEVLFGGLRGAWKMEATFLDGDEGFVIEVTGGVAVGFMFSFAGIATGLATGNVLFFGGDGGISDNGFLKRSRRLLVSS